LQGGAGTYQKEVILPNILRLLGDVKDKVVLDLACGPGFFVREYLKNGARVIGIDISPELIDFGKKEMIKEKMPNVEWFVSGAEKIDMIPANSVDAITIILALQNIERMADVFKECARVLKSDGKLHLVINHPTFRIPKQSEWGWDESKQGQYRRVDKYLTESKEKIDMHPGEEEREYTYSFHRPLQVFFKNLANAGLCVTRLEEWISNRLPPTGKKFKALNASRQEIPMFMYLQVAKNR
jgi:ubiquinone/menaquinone biosynthesis C-methylase UbiE